MKRHVYLAQVNNVFGKGAFLPYSVGLLQAYTLAQPDLPNFYDFKGFVFLREPIRDAVNRMERPDVFAASCYIWNFAYTIALAQAVSEAHPECLIVLGGPHVPNLIGDFFQRYPFVDVLIHGEGEVTFEELLRAHHYCDERYFTQIPGLTSRHMAETKQLATPRERLVDLSVIPSPYLTGVFDELMQLPYDFHASQEMARGCPYTCLAGDTLVNTVYGKKRIDELARDHTEIGVYTYDRATRTAKVATARHLRRTGTNKALVRVHFDDGTHIDCTPDHQFLIFKWGNQFVGEREWVKRADELQAGDRTRAIREEWAGPKRDTCYVAWSRNGKQIRYRMIMEWMIGRPLVGEECVHHKDHDHTNDLPENLELHASALNHIAQHPEVSARMRANNPTKNGLSAEWRAHISAANRGKVRSSDARERYRLAAIKREAAKTAAQRSAQAQRAADTKRARGIPMGNPGERDAKTGQFKGNHVVVAVEPLPGLHDVYCMEVPETGWFYANDVLVHNCTMCDWGSATYTKLRQRESDTILAEMEWMAKHQIDLLYNTDANVGIVKRDYEIVEQLVKIKERYGYPKKFRAAYAKNSNELVFNISKMLADAGMSKGTTLSFQSMDEHTLSIIKRKNIRITNFKELMKRYAEANIPTYTELIIGLPGETYASFANGIDTLLEAGAHDGLQVYTCIAEGATVTTPDGERYIETLRSGDVVYGWHQGQVTPCVIEDVKRSGPKSVWRVEHEHGQIEATDNHPILTSGGWKTVAEIEPGDEVLSDVQYVIQETRTPAGPILLDHLLSAIGRREANPTSGVCTRSGSSESRSSSADPRVRWSSVKSVTYAGHKYVYDLINARPAYNFFANGIVVSNCEALPNSEMSDPKYREVHQIKTVHSPVLFFHNTPQSDPYREHYELVIGTATLDEKGWLDSQMFAWAVQAFHCLNLTRDIAMFLRHRRSVSYRDFYEALLDFAQRSPGTLLGHAWRTARDFYEAVLRGQAPELFDPRYGDVLWPPEELAFLHCATARDQFYLELSSWPMLREEPAWPELLLYQAQTVCAPTKPALQVVALDLPGYFDALHRGETPVLRHANIAMEADMQEYRGEQHVLHLDNWAREVVWYGRKGGNFRNRVNVWPPPLEKAQP
jgi:radical SAM superfamily enzyme YgiQ (UPF0313 family)